MNLDTIDIGQRFEVYCAIDCGPYKAGDAVTCMRGSSTVQAWPCPDFMGGGCLSFAEFGALFTSGKLRAPSVYHPCGERVTPANPIEAHRACYYCGLARDKGYGYMTSR